MSNETFNSCFIHGAHDGEDCPKCPIAESVSPAPQLKSGEMRGFVTYEHPEPVAAPQEVKRYAWGEVPKTCPECDSAEFISCGPERVECYRCRLVADADKANSKLGKLQADYAAKCAELQKAESRLAEVEGLLRALVDQDQISEGCSCGHQDEYDNHSVGCAYIAAYRFLTGVKNGA